MNKIKDITNVRFGKLIALCLNPNIKDSRGALYWDCFCDCGNKKTISGSNLKSGKVRSCGCLRRAEKANKCNLTGLRFGRLTVISESTNKSKTTRWKCLCDCGNQIDVAAGELKKGSIKSCKCLQRELASKRRKANQLGSKNACFNPLLTDEDRIARRFVKGYSEWSFQVKLQAGFSCEKCGDNKGGNLVSHHLYSYMKFKELRLELSNGICLCENCHKKFHDKYGWGDNTKEQFDEWSINE